MVSNPNIVASNVSFDPMNQHAIRPTTTPGTSTQFHLNNQNPGSNAYIEHLQKKLNIKKKSSGLINGNKKSQNFQYHSLGQANMSSRQSGIQGVENVRSPPHSKNPGSEPETSANCKTKVVIEA